MKMLTPLLSLLFVASSMALTFPYSEDFTGFAPAGTDIAATSGDWTSDSAGTLLHAAGDRASVGDNSQLAVGTPSNERVTTTLTFDVVRATAAPTGNAGDQIGFYVDDTTQDAYIWHNDTVGVSGNQWLQLTGSGPIADSANITVTFVQDYTHNRYTVTIGGSTISNALGYSTAGGNATPGPWFEMVQTNNAMAELEIEGSASSPTLVDQIDIDSEFVITADDGTGTAGDAGDTTGDTFTVTSDGANLTILVNGQAYVNGTIPVATPLTIEGTDDDDVLNLDLGGNTMPDITYNGGAGTDSLNLTNANAGTLTYTPTGLNSGTVDFDGNVLTFTGLDPITQSGTINDVVIDDSAAGDHTITISQFSPTQTQVSCSFESITFVNPSNSFTLNANGDDDAIVTDHAAMAGLGALPGGININGNAHTAGDSLTIDGQNNATADDLAGTITGTGWTVTYTTIETVTLLNNTVAVPALDFWGILILSLSLLICGLRNMPGLAPTPVTALAMRAASSRAGACVLTLYVTVLALGSPVTYWDCIGLPIVFALSTYLFAWVQTHQTQVTNEEAIAQ